MPQRETSTSFKKGSKRDPESVRKQSETLKTKYRDNPSSHPRYGKTWSNEQREKFSEASREGRLDRLQLGERKIVNRGTVDYFMIKIGPGTDGWEYEHRHVMSLHLKRGLETSEHVHHINKNPLDNRIENLVIMSPSDHKKLHPSSAKPGAHKLPAGVWARKYNCCIVCGTTKSGHRGKGVCGACGERARRARVSSPVNPA